MNSVVGERIKVRYIISRVSDLINKSVSTIIDREILDSTCYCIVDNIVNYFRVRKLWNIPIDSKRLVACGCTNKV